MSIIAGNDIVASDFISVTTGAADVGKVAKLNARGKMNLSFMDSGSDGSYGALNIASGTVTVDVGGAEVFVMNCTSISITGTGKLAFTNKHANGTLIIVKYNNGLTITSSNVPAVDVSGMGSNAGTDAVSNDIKPTSGLGTTGYTPRFSLNPVGWIPMACGAGGASGSSAVNGIGGHGSASIKTLGTNGVVGAGGSAVAGAAIGTPGIGGGSILFIGDGAVNITSTFWAKGTAATNSAQIDGFTRDGGGSTGGAGGYIGIVGDTITANTATFVTTAGASGASTGGGGTAGVSADGGSWVKTKALTF